MKNETVLLSADPSSQKIEIVVALEADLLACAEMMANSKPWSTFFYSVDECREKLGWDTKGIKVAKVGSEVLGFVVLQRQGLSSSPMISLMCVRDDQRRKGIGTRLVKEVEDEVFQHDKNLFLTVSDFNLGAIRLYDRLGYVRCGEITDYNFLGQSEFLMRKTTGPRREPKRCPQ